MQESTSGFFNNGSWKARSFFSRNNARTGSNHSTVFRTPVSMLKTFDPSSRSGTARSVHKPSHDQQHSSSEVFASMASTILSLPKHKLAHIIKVTL